MGNKLQVWRGREHRRRERRCPPAGDAGVSAADQLQHFICRKDFRQVPRVVDHGKAPEIRQIRLGKNALGHRPVQQNGYLVHLLTLLLR